MENWLHQVAASWRQVAAVAGLPLAAVVPLSALVVHALPQLPGEYFAWLLVAGGAALGLAGNGQLAMKLAVAVLAAGTIVLRAQGALAERIGASHEGMVMPVIGYVEQLPQALDQGVRFRFHIDSCVEPGNDCPAARSIQLSWYQGFGRGQRREIGAPRPGERWRLAVRLKRPVALVNPGTFDGELRALEEGITASGSVVGGAGEQAGNFRLPGQHWSVGTVLERCRMVARDAIAVALASADPAARGTVIALSIGDQAAIPAHWWRVFNQTGIGHLMSISGLHITMLAGLVVALCRRLLSSRLVPGVVLLRVPVPTLAWAIGVSAAFLYSGLAGWGVPAQRTCWMLAVAGGALVSGRTRSVASILALAAGVVTVFDPWAVLAPGFWLSFAAVGAIVLFGSARRIRRRRLLAEAVATQWAATIALLPLGALFFSSISLVGPLANAVAIPLVSIVITPLTLAATALALVVPPLGALLLRLAAWCTSLLLALLDWAAALPLATWTVARPEPLTLALAVAGCALLLAPAALLPRRWGAGLLMPMLAAGPSGPAAGEIWVTALDVGQGSAVLVEVPGYRLLFDAGPVYGGELEAGTRVITPYLRSRGVGRLDAMVISHADTDHTGGALAVLGNFPVGWVASSLAVDHPVVTGAARHFACRRGEEWTWGDADFVFLSPGDDDPVSRKSPTNARSCVLRVTTPAATVVLTGDIEVAQERMLLRTLEPAALKADLLVVPHHGSTTSSSERFLAAVAPALAVFQAGYRNRYRHPHPKVLARYRDAGIEILRSDWHGAITIRYRRGHEPHVERTRIDMPPYWRINPGSDS
ncbi:MAG: DNA internalization-related competence protein ComEC/Rec2 [Burkholderiaceae bacterium]|nr:DNA internalization-related competence protein ComEC/Rec2 [Burkholderiaceae bacterium]